MNSFGNAVRASRCVFLAMIVIEMNRVGLAQAPAPAQESAERERQLLDRIRILEQRISALEARLPASQPMTPPQQPTPAPAVAAAATPQLSGTGDSLSLPGFASG